MRLEIALWCTAIALVGVAAFAAYELRNTRRLRARIAGLEEACTARDAAVARLVAVGLPTAADLTDDSPATAAPAFTVERCLDATAFAQNAGILAQRYTAGVRALQAETAEAVRQRVQAQAHQTTE